MATREFGNYRDILIAIRRRVAEECADGNDRAVYISIDPDFVAPAPNSGTFFYVVSPMNGGFNDAYLVGGGELQATAETGVSVSVYSALQLDQGQHDASFLTNLSLGIVERWRHILAALTNWTPTLNDVLMTRDPLLPTNFGIKRHTRALGGIEQAFSLTFDWYLEMSGVLNPELPDE